MRPARIRHQKMVWTLASFAVCLLGFVVIGALSVRYASDTTDDYLLAGRSVSPWLTALSSVATNNSGFMFIGLIGYAYASGFEAIWLQVAWITGDLLAWNFVHHRIRERSGALGSLSVPSFLATTRDPGGAVRVERVTLVLTGLLTFVFLGGYAAAQLKAGSTTLEVLFGWPATWGAIIGAVIVVIYCFAGGLRASIWTDAAQSMVMIVSMAILIVVAVDDVGGPVALVENLKAQDPNLVKLTPGSVWATLAYVAGFVGGGLAAVGQPHIVIRTMALRDPEEIGQTRRYYFAWFIPFSLFALGVGLAARALLPELTEQLGPTGAAFTAEHALPALSLEVLPAVLVGLMLAGVFAATMSTADSQILSCSAAVTQDVFRGMEKHYWAAKGATLAVALLALTIAVYASQGVFDLVLMAWSVLGSTLGPLVLLRIAGRVPPGWLSALMIASGIATVTFWNFPLVFDVLPGMIVPLLVYAVFSRAVPSMVEARD